MDGADDLDDSITDPVVSLPTRDVYCGAAVHQSGLSPARRITTYVPYTPPRSLSPLLSPSTCFGTILQCDGGDDDDLIEFTDKSNPAAGPAEPIGSSHPSGSQPSRLHGGYAPRLGSGFPPLQPLRGSSIAGNFNVVHPSLFLVLSIFYFLLLLYFILCFSSHTAIYYQQAIAM